MGYIWDAILCVPFFPDYDVDGYFATCIGVLTSFIILIKIISTEHNTKAWRGKVPYFIELSPQKNLQTDNFSRTNGNKTKNEVKTNHSCVIGKANARPAVGVRGLDGELDVIGLLEVLPAGVVLAVLAGRAALRVAPVVAAPVDLLRRRRRVALPLCKECRKH